MKAKDLAEKLLKHPEGEVVVQSDNTMEVNANVSANGVTVYRSAQKTQKHCHDSFDNTSYAKEIWNFSGGDKKVIKISG